MGNQPLVLPPGMGPPQGGPGLILPPRIAPPAGAIPPGAMPPPPQPGGYAGAPMRMYAPAAPPGGAPPLPPMPGGPVGDPVALLAALKELAGVKAPPPKPMYPPGFKIPKEPTPGEIVARADKLWDADRQWRAMIAQTLMWLNGDLSGSFPEDVEERRAGLQEQYLSTALIDERNLVVGKVSTLRASYRVKAHDPAAKEASQKIEDAAAWMRAEYGYRHALRGERPLEIDEATLLTDYGMFVSRQTFDKDNPECPLNRRLIDPTQVAGVWGGRGLTHVYRKYRAPVSRIAADYGDLTPDAKRRIEKEIGALTDDTELEVVEYWDEWWRYVGVGGNAVVAVTAHEYGEVPWTIQHGGMGNPMFTRGIVDAGAWRVDKAWVDKGSNAATGNRVSKATPLIYHRIQGHEIFEAIMARLLTGFKKEINPPMERARSNMAAEKPMPKLDLGPGMQNETMLGEEQLRPIPTASGGPVTQMLLGSLATDRQTGSMPMTAYGQNDKSNVTGVAVANLNDAGNNILIPIIKPLQLAHQREIGQGLRLLRNFGHLAQYGGKTKKSVFVPSRKPGKDAPKAFELDAATIDAGGTRVEITYTKVDPRDWPGLFNAAKAGVEGGIVTRAEVRALAVGDHDFDDFMQEWMEEQAVFQAMQLPEFAKNVTVPMAFAKMIQEHADDPARADLYRHLLMGWMESVKPPAPQPPMGGPPGMPPQGGPPPGGPPPNPGTSAGVSYPQLGQGPGTGGLPVGRPQMSGTSVGP